MDDMSERSYVERLALFKEALRRAEAPELIKRDDERYRSFIEGFVMEGEDLSIDEAKDLIERIYIDTKSKLGIVQKLIEDKDVNEIMINGPGTVFVESSRGIKRIGTGFDSREEMDEVIRNIAASVHREINEMHPILDARLPDGSRVNAVYGNVTLGSPILTIRKFRKERITMPDLLSFGTITEECCEALRELVRAGYNILISGGTSSGKTTFLNALTDFIPDRERVIVIEDSRELMLDGISNLVQMECHNANSQGNGEVSIDMLIRTSLRMRPDRIIVGEVRGREVAMMLQAMNTGHDGSITTSHGNSVEGMLRRIEAMYLMAEDIPLEAIRAQILEGIDILIHLARTKDGKRRVMEVSELTGFRNGKYDLNTLFRADRDMKLIRTGNRLRDRRKLEASGAG